MLGEFIRNGFFILILGHVVCSVHECPVLCTCSTNIEMDCSNQNLQYIPRPSNSQAIEILKFNKNSLRKIGVDTFHSFPNLRTLILEGNIIDSIEKDAFNDLKRLEVLSLKSNVIEDLRFEVFANSTSLSFLDLSWNQLRNIGFDLRSLSSLAELDLSNNKLTSIEENDLTGATDLKRIYLNGNGITTIHPFAFSRCYNLNFIFLSNNFMENLTLHMAGEIQYFDLNNCRLNSYPHLQVKILNYLTLSNNQIRSVRREDVVDIGNSVLELDLSRNLITDIEEGVFSKLPNVKVVDLSNNLLQKVPRKLSGSIRNLNLQNNSISRIDSNSFSDLSVLSKLDLSSNGLEEIQANSFKGLSRLSELHLSNNAIKRLDFGFFTDLRMLKSLYLAHNRAVDVSVVSSGGSETSNNIEILTLTHSKGLCGSLMSHIDRLLKNSSKILDIGSCGLTGREMSKLLLVNSVEEIELCQNDWICSESQWMAPFVDKYPQIYRGSTRCFVCVTSSNEHLSFEELKNMPSTTEMTTTKMTTASMTTTTKSTVLSTSIKTENPHHGNLQEESFYKPRDILVIVSIILAIILLSVVIIISFNHISKVRRSKKRVRAHRGNSSYIRAESLIFSPLKDEIFYGTSKSPEVRTIDPRHGRAIDIDHFNAWIASL